MTDILLIFIIPILICALPFMALFRLINIKSIKNSAENTVYCVVGLFLANLLTCMLAVKISIFGLTRNTPKGEASCLTGVATFFMLSVVFAILTLVFGIFFIYRNYKNLKRHETNS